MAEQTQAGALSRYNQTQFGGRSFEQRESRLRKALEMLDGEPRGRALDLAAGSGLAAEELARRGWEMSALDISEELVEQIRGRGIRDVRVHDLAAGSLPFDGGAFRAVFAGEIIEHLVDTQRFLTEIRRVLEPGGVLVLTTPNLASFENRVRLLLGRYPRWVDYDLSGEGHVRAYTWPTLRRQLRDCRLEPEQVRGNWVPFLPQSRLDDLRVSALARTGDWFPTLSQDLVVKARRPD
jgi:ubiquinone/menaquinone biosynthesis C-methylase UbiE